MAGPGMGAALFGIVFTGALLAVVGLVVQAVGTGWIHALMPPVVMGAIVALIGFNLAQASWSNVVKAAGITDGPDMDSVFLSFVTVIAVVVVAALSGGLISGQSEVRVGNDGL